MDKLEFLDGAEAPNGEVAPAAEPTPAEPQASETPPEPQAEAKPAPARGPDGKFAPKEPVAAAPAVVDPATQAAPAPPTGAPEGYVPLAALLAERDKWKALEAQIPQPQAAPTPTLGPAPDMFDDPDGYQQWQQQQLVNERLNFSEEMTRDKFGDELVDAAKAWATAEFQTRPGFAQEVLSQRNPYGYAVKQYQKNQSLSQLGSDDEIQAYLAWKEAQSAQPGAAIAVPPPQPAVRPPVSIANAPSAGGLQHQAVGPGVAFDETIR